MTTLILAILLNTASIDCTTYINYSDIDETQVSQYEHDLYNELFLDACEVL